MHDSPELLLGRLHETLTKVLVTTSWLDLPEKDRAVVGKIREDAKAVLVSKLLFDTAAIAISGLQGVGKSTLVTQLYDLPPDLLPQSSSRDEKLPILIQEHQGPLKLGGRWVGGDDLTEDRELTQDEFTRAALDPPADLAILTMKVPYRMFRDSTQGLVMLPGLESSLQGSDTKRLMGWEGLVHHAVLSSARCVFVVTPTLLADGANKAALSRLRERFEGMTPIIVISNVDRFDEDMSGYINTAAELAGISPDDVILSGNAPHQQSSARDSLIKALARGVGTGAAFRAMQLRELGELTRDRLHDALSDLRYAIDDSAERIDDREELYVAKTVQKFSDAAEKFRGRLDTALSAALEGQHKAAREQLERQIVEERWWTKLGRLIFDEDLEERRELEQQLSDTWLNCDSGVLNVVSHAVEQQAVAELQPYGELELKPVSSTQKALPLLPEEKEGQALTWVMSGETGLAMSSPDSLGTVLKKAPAVIALMGSVVRDVSFNERPDGEWRLTAGDVDAIFQGIDASEEVRKRAVATLATSVLGADLAADGTVDLIPLIAQKLGFTVSATTANILAAGAALYTVGSAVVATRNQMVKADLARADALGLALDTMKDATVEAMLSQYDSFIDEFRHRLTVRLNRVHKIDENWSRTQASQVAISCANEARKRLVAALEVRATHSLA